MKRLKKCMYILGIALILMLTPNMHTYAKDINETTVDSIQLPQYVTKDASSIKAFCKCPCCKKTALLYCSNKGCIEIVCLECGSRCEYTVGEYRGALEAKEELIYRTNLKKLNQHFKADTQLIETNRKICKRYSNQLLNKVTIEPASTEAIESFSRKFDYQINQENAAFEMRALIRESKLRDPRS